MLAANSWEYVCDEPGQVPVACLPWVKAEIVKSLGSTVGQMFPAFAQAFPLAVSAAETKWSLPRLVISQIASDWLPSLVAENREKNLFFKLGSSARETEGPDFDEYRQMLPPRWKELYRWFESFGITSDSYLGLYWHNTPFGLSARHDLEQFQEHFGGSKGKYRKFARHIGSDRLHCWMVTDGGDTLWLDEERCDKRVYHVKDSRFDDVFVLPDPENLMDRYLAHVLADGNPANFDFRQ